MEVPLLSHNRYNGYFLFRSTSLFLISLAITGSIRIPVLILLKSALFAQTTHFSIVFSPCVFFHKYIFPGTDILPGNMVYLLIILFFFVICCFFCRCFFELRDVLLLFCGFSSSADSDSSWKADCSVLYWSAVLQKICWILLSCQPLLAVPRLCPGKLLFHYQPQCTCNAYRRICTADHTCHQRSCKLTDGRYSKDVQYCNHYKGCKGSINTSCQCLCDTIVYNLSRLSGFLLPCIFSRIRSKMTIVALIE